MIFELINSKMNEIVNKILMTGNKFIPKLHIRQPGFTYSACGPFTKHCERIQKFKQTGDLKYIFKNNLDKLCFVHDAAYINSKDLANRTVSDKVLEDRAYEISINTNYDGYQKGLVNMLYKFFDKKAGLRTKANVKSVLAQEIHKPVLKKFKRRKVYARFKDNVWAADLDEMGPLSTNNQGVKYLLCVIDIFTKYAWVKTFER